jgi:hypothetical protein
VLYLWHLFLYTPMSQFTVKLQYKTCEKGEFFDEHPRTLNETLGLIKDFPWDTQRGVDVQLSGPGIVIKGPDGDYFKIALYFNGKFSAYYLDAGNNLYEHHTANLDDDCSKVKEFFEGILNLDDFEKHLINIGSRAHFTTQTFEYRVNPITEYLRFGAIFICLVLYIGMGLTMLFLKDIPALFAPFVFALGTLFITMEVLMLKIYFRSKNMVIKIAKATDNFEFTDCNGLETYSKKSITEINMYGRLSGKSRQTLTLIELFFNDGRTIIFPGMLIDPIDFMTKLPEGIKINYLEQNTIFSKTRWSF